MDFIEKMTSDGYFAAGSENYFWVWEMEWLPENKREHYSDENISAFAITGGGDVWGFYKGEEEVALLSHEDSSVTMFAPDAVSAVFREIVEYLAEAFDEESGEYSESFAKKYMLDCISVFGEYFSKKQLSEMKKLSKRSLNSKRAFITAEEAREIIEKCLNYDNIDKVFDENCEEIKPEAAAGDNGENVPVRPRTAFDDKFLEKLRTYCVEKIGSFDGTCEKLYEEAKSRAEKSLPYKSGSIDAYLLKIGEALRNGTTDSDTMKKSEDGVKGNCKRYWLDSKNEPVYSEEFLSGFDKTLARRTFYFRENGKFTAVSFIFAGERITSLKIEENEFDENGKCLSYIKFDREDIECYEMYIRENGVLAACDEIEHYEYEEEADDEDDEFDELFGIDENPWSFIKNTYNYENGVITSIYWESGDSPDSVSQKKYDVKEKLYKDFVKKGVI